MKKILVFGASGFVGSHIVHEFVRLPTEESGARTHRANVTLIGVSRDAQRVLDDLKKTHTAQAASLRQIEWESCDPLDRSDIGALFERHPDVTAVISCIGGFDKTEEGMRKANGPPNVNIVHAVVQRPSVQRLVYISAAQIVPKGINRLLRGYYNGKQSVEVAIAGNAASRSLVLQPGFIYGKRLVRGKELPLGAVGRPLELITKPLYGCLGWKLLTPPISATTVARCALGGCLTDAIGASGKLDTSAMHEFARNSFHV